MSNAFPLGIVPFTIFMAKNRAGAQDQHRQASCESGPSATMVSHGRPKNISMQR